MSDNKLFCEPWIVVWIDYSVRASAGKYCVNCEPEQHRNVQTTYGNAITASQSVLTSAGQERAQMKVMQSDQPTCPAILMIRYD